MQLLVALLLAGAAAAAPRRLAAEGADGGDGAAKTSPLWGVAGEKWEADGPFIDFSYAGALLPGRWCWEGWRRADTCAAPAHRRARRSPNGRSLAQQPPYLPPTSPPCRLPQQRCCHTAPTHYQAAVRLQEGWPERRRRPASHGRVGQRPALQSRYVRCALCARLARDEGQRGGRHFLLACRGRGVAALPAPAYPAALHLSSSCLLPSLMYPIPSTARPPRPPATLPAGWVVLSLPPGQIQLDRTLSIRRSQTVLRGAGRDATTLYITKSLSQVGGGDYWRRRLAGQPAGGRQGNETHTVPSAATDGPGSTLGPSAAQHGRRLHASRWTTSGGWISAPGERKSEELARVTSSEQRGSYTIKVERGGGLGLVHVAGRTAAARQGPLASQLAGLPLTLWLAKVGHGLQGS